MNGHIYTNLLLTCAGNRFLRGGDVSGFWPGSDAFRFTGLCEFRQAPADGKEDGEYPLVAADPIAWFDGLKSRARGLRLHHTARTRAANQQIEVSDRMLAGLVGGGQRWFVEVVGEEASELWEGFERIGDRNAVDRKIWLWTFIHHGMAPRALMDTDLAGFGLEAAVGRLREALTAIEAYARAETHDNFAEVFREALGHLQTGAKAEDWGDLRFTGFDARQAAVLSAASRASVFGGMGSWNDLGGGPAYDKVSEDLYAALNDCTVALANSTFAG